MTTASLVTTLQDTKGCLELAGDERSYSPGHAAKYGGYNVNDQRIDKVLEIQVVQVQYNNIFLLH